ncbi:MAG: hypothetical protein Q8P68_05900 [Candidatus Peregrinibacteria bacterium]|nr:hypothetical protein [Candidatus Peregrinibacteria bacterium]MDZ4244958.1 hypothetical protein [Candidatus Gracilibacteria bacterium]
MSLKNRQVDKVLINDTDGTKYELTMIESLSPLKHMLKIIKEEGPINITRPEEDIFDW